MKRSKGNPRSKSGKSKKTKKPFNFGGLTKMSVATLIGSTLGTIRDAFGESTTFGSIGPMPIDIAPTPIGPFVGPITYP